MTFVTFSNLILMLLCIAVIVQSIRMAKSLRALRTSTLDDSVVQLDRAAQQARAVLAELKSLLATDGIAQAKAIASAETLRDELSVMVGIGNAVADRIMDAVAAQGEAKAQKASAPQASDRRQSSRKPRSRMAAARHKASAAAVLAATVSAETMPVAGHA